MRRFLVLVVLLSVAALTWPAVPVIQTKSERKETTNVTSTTITAPSGITDGDVLIICSSADGVPVFTWPTGFTEIDQGFADAFRESLGCSYKIASSESGNYDVGLTVAEEVISEMYRVDGADSGSEIQDPNETNTGTSTTATITPATSTSSNDSLVFCVHGMDDGDVTIDGGGDADYSVEDVDESSVDTGNSSIGVQIKSIATAATPPVCDLTLTASNEFRAMWFAVLSPAGGAGLPRRRVITQ